MSDKFNGDDAHLVSCIKALFDLDKSGSLVPHGIGGHARTMLEAAASRLEALAGEAVAVVETWTNGSYHRNYKLRWLKDVEVGAQLFVHPPIGDAAGKDSVDAARLDWLIDNRAWINWTERDGSIIQCQAFTQDEDENYHVLSGEHRFFNTPREAIDAAINAAIASLTEPATGETQ